MIETDSNTSAKSGQIQKSGFFYTVDTATATPRVSYNPNTGTERRSFFSFDTSAIPTKARIIKVEFNWNVAVATSPLGQPLSWITEFYTGTFIGAALDSTDWASGTLAASYTGGPTTQWIDLGSQGISDLNTAGDTDVRVSDNSLWLGTPGEWSHTLTKNRCYLRVTWFYHQYRQTVFPDKRRMRKWR